jgi:hypothetical protein
MFKSHGVEYYFFITMSLYGFYWPAVLRTVSTYSYFIDDTDSRYPPIKSIARNTTYPSDLKEIAVLFPGRVLFLMLQY